MRCGSSQWLKFKGEIEFLQRKALLRKRWWIKQKDLKKFDKEII